MKLNDLKTCPFCGYDNFYNIKNRKYCNQCHRYLGCKDKVGKLADKQCLYNSFQNESKEVKAFFERALSNSEAFKKKIREQYKHRKDFLKSEVK